MSFFDDLQPNMYLKYLVMFPWNYFFQGLVFKKVVMDYAGPVYIKYHCFGFTKCQGGSPSISV